MSLGSQKTTPTLTLLCGFFCALKSATVLACPDMGGFYEDIENTPERAEARLLEVLDQCSASAEYFALLGAAQLASGNLFQALENLELSLLLDPDNGVAMVDYAEVLYRQGDIFSALELNAELLSRDDLPQGLQEGLLLRQRRWSRARVQSSLVLSGSFGYDANLNNAPVSDRLALTLSGNSITLEVSPEYQAREGSYTKLSAGGDIRRLGRSFNAQLSGKVRGRFSNDSRFELLQASAQTFVTQASEDPRWDAVIGGDHIAYGGHAIFSSSTLRARYLAGRRGACTFYPAVALQYQYFHTQSLLSGVEKSLGFGADCSLTSSNSTNRFGLELSVLTNEGTSSGRLGSDRDGWRTNFVWRRQFARGEVFAQYVWTKLEDKDGYSPLFDSGEKREESLNSMFLQYAAPWRTMGRNAQIFANLSYHDQNSTIDLFKTRGFASEVGINWRF